MAVVLQPGHQGFSVAGKYVISSKLNLYEKWSQSCTPRRFDLYSMTAAVTSATTWNTQPGWSMLQGSATVAKGYSPAGLGGASSCPAGTVSVDATQNTQIAANSGGDMTLGIRAADETNNDYWKRFDNNPTLSVTYTAFPDVTSMGTDPATLCTRGPDRPYVNTITPQLKAAFTDPDSSATTTTFEWWPVGGTTRLGTAANFSVPEGQATTVTVPAGTLVSGGTYMWRVRAFDGASTSPWSPWCEFTVDLNAPTVSSATYPSEGWAGAAGTPGSFTFSPAGMSNVVDYVYGLDSNPPSTTVAASPTDQSATVTITPESDGPHTLYVRSRQQSGDLSAPTAYSFGVGSGVSEVSLIGEQFSDDVVMASELGAGLGDAGASSAQVSSVTVGTPMPESTDSASADSLAPPPADADAAAAESQAEADGVPAGSYRIVASWQRFWGQIMILRAGYYIAPNTGFGQAKIWQKHGLTIRTVRLAAERGVAFSTAGQKVNYRTPARLYRCSGWWLWRKCVLQEVTGIIVGHDYRKINDNYAFGVVTAYCDTYMGKCPSWVNRTVPEPL